MAKATTQTENILNTGRQVKVKFSEKHIENKEEAFQEDQAWFAKITA